MELQLNLAGGGYSVFLGKGLLFGLSDFIHLNRKVFLVTDDGVPEKWVQAVQAQCPDCHLETVPQGEGAKSFPVYERLCSRLLEVRFGRREVILALGGGVIGDLAGFAAATYLRGIDFVNIPTTTLSQIDSSIGGKVAINLDGVKNCVGAYYQPQAVLVDSEVLSTLPARHYANGLVEAVKAGLIYDPELFKLFEQGDAAAHLDEIILRSLRVKKAVVEQDEKESGLRRILNFGHTIGHGVESVYGLSGLYHGEAVAVGMLPMIESPALRERTERVLRGLGINPRMPYDPEAVYEVMTRDKKTHGGQITIVTVAELGKACLEDVPMEALKSRLCGKGPEG